MNVSILRAYAVGIHLSPLPKIQHLILATKSHKGPQRKEDNKNHLNQKFLRRGPGGAVFSKSVPPGRLRQKRVFAGLIP